MAQLSNYYDLEDLALETGGKVSYSDGRQFNTSGMKATRKPVESAPKAPPPPPVVETPKTDPATTELLRQVVALLNRPVEVKLPDMPAPQVVVNTPDAPKAAPVTWSFEFERNPNGTIKRITASQERD
jgi:hypothetical protein